MKKLAKGQTMVMVVLLTVVVASVASAVVALVTTNALNVMREERGNQALLTAETGVEEGLLRLLRDPNYAGGVLTTAKGSATVLVEGGAAKTVSSEAVVGGYVRRVEAQVRIEQGRLFIDSWREM